jgi:hypothetical protein
MGFPARTECDVRSSGWCGADTVDIDQAGDLVAESVRLEDSDRGDR